MFGKIIKSLSKLNSKRIYSTAQKRAVAEYFTNLNDSNLPELSELEETQIKNKWKRIIDNPQIGYHAFKAFKYFDCFDVNYVPEPYFYPYIIRSLNPTQDYVSLTHKGLIDSIFGDLPRPVNLVKRISGNMLDNNFNILSEDDVIDIVLNTKCNKIIKPAKDTNSGRGVEFIPVNINRKELINILRSHDKDYVIQKVVNQSDFTAKFNPTSLNTIRVATLFINNRLSKCFALIKLGSKGHIVDNLANGGLWVGIDKNGYLRDFGCNNHNEVYTSHNGIILKGQKIPNFDKVVELAYMAHKHISSCGFAGWDIALDSDNNPLLIEANLWWPGISYGEICNGPIFGERTDEVIEFVRTHPVAPLKITPTV